MQSAKIEMRIKVRHRLVLNVYAASKNVLLNSSMLYRMKKAHCQNTCLDKVQGAYHTKMPRTISCLDTKGGGRGQMLLGRVAEESPIHVSFVFSKPSTIAILTNLLGTKSKPG